MSMLDAIRYRLYLLTHRDEADRDAAEEIAFHLRLGAIEDGAAIPAAVAYAAARRRFGNVTWYREELRRVSGTRIMSELLQDARFALRSFRRTPTFTAIAVLTLAVGIGANTAIFSAVNALLLRPLPFREPERLMNVSITMPAFGNFPARTDLVWSYPRFQVFRDGQNVFEDMTLWSSQKFTLRVGDESVREAGEFTDSRYLPILGEAPAIGRAFIADEDRPGAPRVAFISDRLWHQLFNAGSIKGRTIDVDGTPFEVVGVTRPKFRGLSGGANIWIPLASPPVNWSDLMHDPNNNFHHLIGRLAPGKTPAQATAVAHTLGAAVDAAFPLRLQGVTDIHAGATATELDGLRVDMRIRRTLFILTGAVGLVLLICCANVANLFLVRASSRRREIATRLALGASRARLIRQLLVESVLLSVVGGVGAVLIAWGGVRVLSSLKLASVLRLQDMAGIGTVDASTIHLDAVALGFAALLAVGTGMLFGLVPAVQATRPSLTSAIKEDTGHHGRSRRFSSRNMLVTVEIALAVVLLAGSGLMMRSLAQLLAVKPGFEPSNVLAARVNRSPLWARDSISRFYDVATQRLANIPGVTDAAMIDCAPLESCDGTDVHFPGRPEVQGVPALAGMHWVTPGFFRTLRIPVLAGRDFDTRDKSGNQRVVILNETAAREFWPGEDPVGRPIRLGNSNFDSAMVIGVVGDVHYGTMDSLPKPDVYISYYQRPFSFRMMLFVRTRGDPGSRAADVRNALKEVAPGFPMYDVSTMSARLNSTVAYARFSAVLLTLFATVALVLAAMGTYGVMSFVVAQRTREIGVRSALGATRGVIVRLVIGQGVSLAIAGTVIGLVGAVAATRVLTSLLYEVRPSDPITLIGIVGVLIVAVLVASWIPARRAVGIPVVQALRAD